MVCYLFILCRAVRDVAPPFWLRMPDLLVLPVGRAFVPPPAPHLRMPPRSTHARTRAAHIPHAPAHTPHHPTLYLYRHPGITACLYFVRCSAVTPVKETAASPSIAVCRYLNITPTPIPHRLLPTQPCRAHAYTLPYLRRAARLPEHCVPVWTFWVGYRARLPHHLPHVLDDLAGSRVGVVVERVADFAAARTLPPPHAHAAPPHHTYHRPYPPAARLVTNGLVRFTFTLQFVW